MEKFEKDKQTGQKMDQMEPMDQAMNLIVQAVNNATGLDKGNDGKEANQK